MMSPGVRPHRDPVSVPLPLMVKPGLMAIHFRSLVAHVGTAVNPKQRRENRNNRRAEKNPKRAERIDSAGETKEQGDRGQLGAVAHRNGLNEIVDNDNRDGGPCNRQNGGAPAGLGTRVSSALSR